MEQTKITKFGGSLGVILDRSITTKMFGWKEGTQIEIDYDDVQNKRIVISQKIEREKA